MTKETGFPWPATQDDLDYTCPGCGYDIELEQRITWKEDDMWHARCYMEYTTRRKGTAHGYN